MIKFFKRLFAALFGKKAEPKKSLTDQAIDLLHKEQLKNPGTGPVSVDLNPKKFGIFKRKTNFVSMKNNRLHIQYNGASGRNGHNVPKKNWRTGRLDWSMGSMYKDRIDSMRCTRLERAEQIVGQIQRYCIERAVFKNAAGNEFKLI